MNDAIVYQAALAKLKPIERDHIAEAVDNLVEKMRVNGHRFSESMALELLCALGTWLTREARR